MNKDKLRLLCHKCGYECRDYYTGEAICPECGQCYLLPRDQEKETPGIKDDHKFMQYNPPEKPVRDFLTTKVQWDCPTCRRPNFNKKKGDGMQVCICQHCGNVVRVNMGGSVRQK